MQHEAYLVSCIKDAACYVSTDVAADLAACRAGGGRLEYVLPDGVAVHGAGFAREPAPKAPKGAPPPPAGKPKEQARRAGVGR